MSNEYLANLASLSTKIINNPEKNIIHIKDILLCTDSITLLSVYKIFKNIIPLYKVKIIEDSIKHKKEYIRLQEHDRRLYTSYKHFIDIICKKETHTSYQIAVDILLNIDHFNFVERVISKIFRGMVQKEFRRMCVEGVVRKMRTDSVGETSMKIVIEMMDVEKWCNLVPEVYEAICDINIINALHAEELEKKVQKKVENREDKITKRMMMANKHGKNIEKSRLKSRGDKKADAEMNKIKQRVDFAEGKTKEEDRIKMLKKIVDNTMRVYFIILKEKKFSLFIYAFRGLAKYRRFIRREFLDGLVFLLNDCLTLGNYKEKINCLTCIIKVFGDREYEFRNILDNVYEIITPFRHKITRTEMDDIHFILQFLFIKKRQSQKMVFAFLHRILQFSCTNYNMRLTYLVREIMTIYKIDWFDFDFDYNQVQENVNLENFIAFPLYELSIMLKHDRN